MDPESDFNATRFVWTHACGMELSRWWLNLHLSCFCLIFFCSLLMCYHVSWWMLMNIIYSIGQRALCGGSSGPDLV